MVLVEKSPHFVLAKLATTSIRVKELDPKAKSSSQFKKTSNILTITCSPFNRSRFGAIRGESIYRMHMKIANNAKPIRKGESMMEVWTC